MLNEKEIRELWKSVEPVTSDDAMRMIKIPGGIPGGTKPMLMSNVYSQ